MSDPSSPPAGPPTGPAGGDLPSTQTAPATENPAAAEAPLAASTEASTSDAAEQPKGKSPVRWILMVVGIVVVWQLWDWRSNVTGPGKAVDAPITLITADRDDLACAMDRTVGKYRCEVPAPGKTWPQPPSTTEKLMPYFTTDRQMYLIAGLFEQPTVAARYTADPPQGQPRDKLRRFVAHCRLHLVQKVEGVQTRWQANGNWNNAEPTWVAEIVGNCQAADQ
jgi:hypothetical protein